MWIPTPIYERIPQFWLLLGLLFMSSGIYLSFEYELSFFYFGVGFTCCLWSTRIFVMRLTHQKALQENQSEHTDQPSDDDSNADVRTTA